MNAGNDVSGEQRAVELNGVVTDPGTAVGETVTSHWVVTDAQGNTVGTSDSLNWTFQSPDFGIYKATLTATDSNGATTNASVTLDLYNVPPTVNAGPDIQQEGLAVQLTAVATDPGTAYGETLTSHWVVTDAQGNTVGTGNSLNWTFQAPAFGTYTATLTATDNYGAASSDSATLTLSNVAPVVNAGADTTVRPGVPVTLAGSFTDPGQATGETYVSTWTVRNSAGVAVAIQQGLTLTFATHTNDVYSATLSVADSNGGVGTGTRTITVAPILPVVNAGANVSIDLNDGPVTQTGSFTDAAALPNEAYTVGWVVANSSGAQVMTATGLTLNYTPAAAGLYTATLTVTDSDGNSGAGQFNITVNNAHFATYSGAQIVQTAGVNTGTVTLGRFQDIDLGQAPASYYDVKVNWGDGSALEDGTLRWDSSTSSWCVDGSHTYNQNSYSQPGYAYPITVSVYAKGGNSPAYPSDRYAVITTSAEIQLRDTDNPLVLGVSFSPNPPQAGAPVTATITYADLPNTYHQIWLDWGDGSSSANYDYSNPSYSSASCVHAITFQHTYASPGMQYTLTATVGRLLTDDPWYVYGEGYAQVQTVLPSVEAGADVTVQEGNAVTLSGTVSSTLSDYTAGWEIYDTFSNEEVATSSGTSITFTPPDVSKYRAIFSVTSDNVTTSDMLHITVTNVPPFVSAAFTINKDQSIDLNGSFTDPGQAEGELYAISWQIYDQNNVCVASDLTQNVHFIPPGDPATYTYHAVFTVTDDGGGTGSTTLLLVPAPTQPALAAINSSGQLGLYLGGDVSNRVNSAGTLTGAQATEDYSLTRVSNDPGSSMGETIQIVALGYSETFTNVESVLVNNTADSGGITTDVTIQIDNAINVPVTMTLGGGTGTRSTITTGSGTATIYVTGDGDNQITTGNNPTISVTGKGDNTITTGSITSGSITILGNGNNAVTSSGGSGAIRVSGTGDNGVTINGAYSGTVTLTSAASGSNTISISAGSAAGGSPTVVVDGNGSNKVVVSGGSGSTETIYVNGNGKNYIDALGLGSATVYVAGNGNNVITTGKGRATVYLTGSGDNAVDTASGFATVYDESSGANSVFGGLGGGLYIGGLDRNGNAYTTKGASDVETTTGHFSVQVSGYSSYTLSDSGLTY
ncbi:MAG: PKD domain-containing protein, partial [Verrucomicrobiota bacterium]